MAVAGVNCTLPETYVQRRFFPEERSNPITRKTFTLANFPSADAVLVCA